MHYIPLSLVTAASGDTMHTRPLSFVRPLVLLSLRVFVERPSAVVEGTPSDSGN